MKRVLAILTLLFVAFAANAQSENLIIIDQNSFRPVQTDALTGANIDPISVDSSRRPCARIKVKINRMTPDDINKIDVKIITNNQLTKCKTADYENGLILEMTAKPATRFYFNHPEFGQSNEVTLNLDQSKEYYMEASLNQLYSIVVNSNVEGAEVYLDNIYKGVTNHNYNLTVKEVLPGEHTLKVVYGGAAPEQKIFVSSSAISFKQHINITAAVPQHVVFKLTPMDAVVEIDGSTIYGTIEGEGYVDKLLRSGSYDYTVSAPNYHTYKGSIVVRDQKITETVTLKPAVGYLQIAGSNLGDAVVYIDGKNIGKMPISPQMLPSGEHTVRVLMARYKPYEVKVVVVDEQTTTVTPELEPNFAKVTLQASDSETEIWLNDNFVANGAYTAELEFGSYAVEGRKVGHHSMPKVFDIRTSEPTTITLSAPTPIYGAIDVSSTPMAAKILIDGKDCGKQTPDTISNVLVGVHTITIIKQGYKTNNQKVVVSENQVSEVKVQLVSDGSVPKPTPAPKVKPPKAPKPQKTPKQHPQTAPQPKNRFENSVDLGYSMHAQPGGMINHIGLNYIGGLRVNRIFVGLGLGAEFNFDGIDNSYAVDNAWQNFSNHSSGGTMMSSGAISVPLYLHFRAYMGSRSRTFVAVSAGGKLFGSDSFTYDNQTFKYNTNGVFADLGFGLQLGKFYLSAAATTQTIPCAEFASEKQIDLKSKLGYGAKLSLGFTF